MAIDDHKHRRSSSRDGDTSSSKRLKHRHDDLEEGEILDDDDIPLPNLVVDSLNGSKDSRPRNSRTDDEKLSSVNGDLKHHSQAVSPSKQMHDRDSTKLGSRHRTDRIRERSRSKSHDRTARDHRAHDRDNERYSRDIDHHERDRDHHERDRDRDHRDSKHRDRDRERDRDHRESRERDRKRESERGRSREMERDHRTREKERERKREREHRHRDSDRERKRERDRDIVSDRRHNNNNNNRDRDRNDEHRHSSKHDDNKNPLPISLPDSLKRDEDGLEDYDDTPALQLDEQEEEDLNRIKEESRRRKQAILEKYKNKQKTNAESESANKDTEASDHTGVPKSPTNSDKRVVDDSPAPASFSVGKSPPLNGAPEEITPKSERLDGVFCDDIFGETPTGVRKAEKSDGVQIERSGLHDNWDDAEGYYGYRFGELLDGRYEITAAHGKGVFSTVVRARNVKASNGQPEEVAIKIIRSNETMYKAGMLELVILKKLADQDPEDKRHCVRFLSNFMYRNHLCLVFESLSMNLRELLKKFGRNIGLKLTAVRVYAKQLFIALKHLKNCGVLHCDIKPDNMLVNEAKNVLKLCDFGNAMFSEKNEVTPYLVSRFYRAPEIILGLPYDHPLDIWSVGCCLAEFYTGQVLFRGASNKDMLRLHMELKGHFPKKMIRKGAFKDQNFDQDLNFIADEVSADPLTKKIIKRTIINIKQKDIGYHVVGSPGEDPKMLADFKDLLDKMFTLDPEKRLTVSQALSHPFITGK